MMRHFIYLLIVMSTLGISGHALAQDIDCEAVETMLPPRLIIGEEGRVLHGTIMNVRAEPGVAGAHIGRIPSDSMFTVLDGPRCVDGYLWWQIDYHHVNNGIIGWIAEGDVVSAEYWLEPRGEHVMITDSEGYQWGYLIADDGTVEPEGCLTPPEDYARTWLGYAQLNERTLFMLDQAHRLYEAWGGRVDFRSALTQGSYTGGLEVASFGTHDGGGAIDLSVRSPIDWSVLTGDIDPMIHALRVAGFAAWVRDEDVFYRNSPIHIHAIAVGDAELSEAAREQVMGAGGYLAGYDGLPAEYNGPNPDPHGGAIICRWMVEQGWVEALPTLDELQSHS